jgi:hypothetical protein
MGNIPMLEEQIMEPSGGHKVMVSAPMPRFGHAAGLPVAGLRERGETTDAHPRYSDITDSVVPLAQALKRAWQDPRGTINQLITVADANLEEALARIDKSKISMVHGRNDGVFRVAPFEESAARAGISRDRIHIVDAGHAVVSNPNGVARIARILRE